MMKMIYRRVSKIFVFFFKLDLDLDIDSRASTRISFILQLNLFTEFYQIYVTCRSRWAHYKDNKRKTDFLRNLLFVVVFSSLWPTPNNSGKWC